ncbi:MAG: exosortase C-terminal domain/associated protein EpsI [Phycisphaerae bacterium]
MPFTRAARLPCLVLAGGLVAFGAGYRALATYLEMEPNHIVMARGTLATLPLRIGAWEGRELPIEEAIIQRTDTDDHLSRTYTRDGGRDAVTVFVGYGVRARDLQPHRPDICYPSAGWTLRGTERVELALARDAAIPAQQYEFFRGGFDRSQVIVLGFYIVDGRFSHDVSLLRSRAWRGAAGVKYVAQVQVSAAGGALRTGRAAESVRQFAQEFAPHVIAKLTEVENAARRAGE